MKTMIFFTLTSIFIAGCVPGSPAAICCSSPEKLKTFTDEQLCQSYSFCNGTKIKNELKARGTFTEQEWTDIDAGKFYTGMSKKALLATLFVIPSGMLSDSGGTIEIYEVFQRNTYGTVYFYVQNNRVISWKAL